MKSNYFTSYELGNRSLVKESRANQAFSHHEKQRVAYKNYVRR